MIRAFVILAILNMAAFDLFMMNYAVKAKFAADERAEIAALQQRFEDACRFFPGKFSPKNRFCR